MKIIKTFFEACAVLFVFLLGVSIFIAPIFIVAAMTDSILLTAITNFFCFAALMTFIRILVEKENE
jgi:hypothetical protein